jgi:hypothetical protein
MERLQEMAHVPKPRDAASVAINMGERPALNSPKTQSRSRLRKSLVEIEQVTDETYCPLSPWMARAGQPS